MQPRLALRAAAPPSPAPLMHEDVVQKTPGIELFQSFSYINKAKNLLIKPGSSFLHPRPVLGSLLYRQWEKIALESLAGNLCRRSHGHARNSWQSSAMRKLHLIGSHLHIKAIRWQHEKTVFKN